MGFWNTTCMITNLPIAYDEEVYGLFLGKTTDKEVETPYVYSVWDWHPMGYMFEGKYNDYGAIYECDNTVFPYVLDTIRKNLVELEVGENEYHDIAVNKEWLKGEEELFEASHENRLFVKSVWKQELRHVTIKKEVFDKLYAEWYPHVKTKCENSFKEIKELLTANSVDYMERYKASELFPISRRSDMFGYGGFFELKEDYFEAIEKNDVQKIEMFEESIRKLYTLCHYMHDGRISFHPTGGEGSQSFNMEAQELRAKLTLETADKIRKEWALEDYNGEDYD